VTTPLGIPNTGSHALEPCKVQVITNDIFDMQPTAESQMCPVVHSAERHADFGAAPASPTFHSSSADFHTARSRLSHEFVPVASSSSSSSTSSWSPSSLDSLASIDQKVVSDRSASDRSERSCSGRQPSSVRMQHEVPSVSVVRPQVVFPTTAQQVAAHTGPAVKSASTAQKSSKVHNFGNSFCIPSLPCKDYLAMLPICPVEADIAIVHGLYCALALSCPCCYTV
jgi:hypothetical protein